jgi:hypothetical protein
MDNLFSKVVRLCNHVIMEERDFFREEMRQTDEDITQDEDYIYVVAQQVLEYLEHLPIPSNVQENQEEGRTQDDHQVGGELRTLPTEGGAEAGEPDLPRTLNQLYTL